MQADDESTDELKTCSQRY